MFLYILYEDISIPCNSAVERQRGLGADPCSVTQGKLLNLSESQSPPPVDMENSIWHLRQRAAARIKGDRAWEGLSSSMKSAFDYAASTSFSVYCELKPVLGRKMVIKNSTHT